MAGESRTTFELLHFLTQEGCRQKSSRSKEFFLGTTNKPIADLENFKGSFAGGVYLKVFSADRRRAVRLLNKYAPDLIWEDEDELDYAVTCPKCQSADIVFDEAGAQPEDGEFLDKFHWTCAACGHQWQDEGVSHIVDSNARGHSSSSD